jgi:nucleoside-diphosphate-sugar epimerase
MASKFVHEEIYRGADALAKLTAPLVTICGAGALGSHLADNLARQGFSRLRVIDRDRVEQHNVGTQLYAVADVGARKVDVLRHRLFRAVEVEVDAVAKEMSERTARSLLKGSDLVVDTSITRRRAGWCSSNAVRTASNACMSGYMPITAKWCGTTAIAFLATSPETFANTPWPATWCCWPYPSPRKRSFASCSTVSVRVVRPH